MGGATQGAVLTHSRALSSTSTARTLYSYNTGLWSELRLQHVVGVGIVLQREEATAGMSAAEALTAPARTDDRAHAARDGRQALQIVSSSLSGDRKDTEV